MRIAAFIAVTRSANDFGDEGVAVLSGAIKTCPALETVIARGACNRRGSAIHAPQTLA